MNHTVVDWSVDETTQNSPIKSQVMMMLQAAVAVSAVSVLSPCINEASFLQVSAQVTVTVRFRFLRDRGTGNKQKQVVCVLCCALIMLIRWSSQDTRWCDDDDGGDYGWYPWYLSSYGTSMPNLVTHQITLNLSCWCWATKPLSIFIVLLYYHYCNSC